MKNSIRSYIGYFLSVLLLIGCGTANPVSNSAGPSTPNNIILNATVNPPSTDVGGEVIITATAIYANNGMPASGILISSAASSGGTISGSASTTDSNGQIFIPVKVSSPTTVVITLEDISVSVRINISGR